MDIILPKGKENIVAINVIAQHVLDLLNGVAKRPQLKKRTESTTSSGTTGQLALPQKTLNSDAKVATRARNNSENTKPFENKTHLRLH